MPAQGSGPSSARTQSTSTVAQTAQATQTGQTAQAAQQALVTRRGVLPATGAGAVVGAAMGVLVDRRMGTADPTFAGAIGAGLGAVLGRSAWIRVGVARIYGIQPIAMIGILFGRIVGCVALGLGIIGTSPQRFAYIGVGIALLVVTAMIEQRWLRRHTGERPAIAATADVPRSAAELEQVDRTNTSGTTEHGR